MMNTFTYNSGITETSKNVSRQSMQYLHRAKKRKPTWLKLALEHQIRNINQVDICGSDSQFQVHLYPLC
jgi:hypothetical protein